MNVFVKMVSSKLKLDTQQPAETMMNALVKMVAMTAAKTLIASIPTVVSNVLALSDTKILMPTPNFQDVNVNLSSIVSMATMVDAHITAKFQVDVNAQVAVGL